MELPWTLMLWSVTILFGRPAWTQRITRQNGASPVYIASQNGHVEVVRVLIAAGADVKACREVRGCMGGLWASEARWWRLWEGGR